MKKAVKTSWKPSAHNVKVLTDKNFVVPQKIFI